jgi:hypothetical protein
VSFDAARRARESNFLIDAVMECTDDTSLPKAERKAAQIRTAPHKSPEASKSDAPLLFPFATPSRRPYT